jgi:hypothetical protein
MKVKIGKYRSWIGPYQIAKALCFWVPNVKDEYDRKSKPSWVHNFGRWLSENSDGSDSTLLKVCTWIESKRNRQIYVRVDNYDTWSLDSTLALVAYPMLKQLQATKHGAPCTDDEDVPSELKSTAAEPKENDWDTDSNHFKRWDWIMNEMIWAFEQKTVDDSESQFYTHAEKILGESLMESVDRIKIDEVGLAAHMLRKKNGFRLFGKYYEALWD